MRRRFGLEPLESRRLLNADSPWQGQITSDLDLASTIGRYLQGEFDATNREKLPPSASALLRETITDEIAQTLAPAVDLSMESFREHQPWLQVLRSDGTAADSGDQASQEVPFDWTQHLPNAASELAQGRRQFIAALDLALISADLNNDNETVDWRERLQIPSDSGTQIAANLPSKLLDQFTAKAERGRSNSLTGEPAAETYASRQVIRQAMTEGWNNNEANGSIAERLSQGTPLLVRELSSEPGDSRVSVVDRVVDRVRDRLQLVFSHLASSLGSGFGEHDPNPHVAVSLVVAGNPMHFDTFDPPKSPFELGTYRPTEFHEGASGVLNRALPLSPVHVDANFAEELKSPIAHLDPREVPLVEHSAVAVSQVHLDAATEKTPRESEAVALGDPIGKITAFDLFACLGGSSNGLLGNSKTLFPGISTAATFVLTLAVCYYVKFSGPRESSATGKKEADENCDTVRLQPR